MTAYVTVQTLGTLLDKLKVFMLQSYPEAFILYWIVLEKEKVK